MLATRGQPFDSKNHLFEVKWDGIRALAFCSQNKVRLQGRKLTDSTARYPDLVAGLRQLPGEVVLDGEIVALVDGKPDFQRVLLRELAGQSQRADFLARQHPVLYVAFDLLFLDGREIVEQPLHRRRQLLSRLLGDRPPHPILESSYVLARGRDYYQEAVKRKLEGIVAKDLESPYVIGRRTSYWIKIKARHEIDCVVMGTVVETGTNRVKSLVLGTYRDNKLVWMGNVGSGLDSALLEQLATQLEPLSADSPEGIRVTAPGEIRWLKPVLVARVHFMELTHEGRLRAPVFMGFTNQSPEACRIPE